MPSTNEFSIFVADLAALVGVVMSDLFEFVLFPSCDLGFRYVSIFQVGGVGLR
ncbi:MAG: hypothetical protein VX764_09485 [Planctomycetota bacterium]|nr:hypothetical protein [Planctomycetota bacterium]